MTPPDLQACVVCGKTDWLPLPDVGAGRSVTTGGWVTPHPLGKTQCRPCGLLQRTAATLLAGTDFYEKRYGFFERPGADRFDRPRYAAMAGWIRASMPTAPASVLDAGCGRGWMLDAMSVVYPAARFTGIEPSEAESEMARQRFDVTTARVGTGAKSSARFDLVYATNVLEHTESPADFLAGLRERLAPGGHIVITCPDASSPSAEMLFSDQNFSFLPAHLEALASRAGLEVVRWSGPPGDVSLRDKQLAVMRPLSPDREVGGAAPRAENIEGLYQRRCDYLNAWTSCHEKLSRECRTARCVNNFGTSTWSFLLAAYCPEYWSRVTCCMIDGGSGEFLGKPVRDTAQVSLAAGDVVVMGVDPDMQARFAAQFAGSPARTVTWNDIIAR